MSVLEAIRLALAQIRAQKLKSFFTLLGVGIGVTFLIAVVSIIDGMGRYMEDDLVGKLITKNAFDVRRQPNIDIGDVGESEWRAWRTRTRTRPRIAEHDVPAIVAALPPDVRWAYEGSDALGVESRYASPRKVLVQCVEEQWFDIRNRGVQEGRLPSQQEYALGAPVVVLGAETRNRILPALSPIGRKLRIGNIPYTVIGVAEKQGSGAHARGRAAQGGRRGQGGHPLAVPDRGGDADRHRCGGRALLRLAGGGGDPECDGAPGDGAAGGDHRLVHRQLADRDLVRALPCVAGGRARSDRSVALAANGGQRRNEANAGTACTNTSA